WCGPRWRGAAATTAPPSSRAACRGWRTGRERWERCRPIRLLDVAVAAVLARPGAALLIHVVSALRAFTNFDALPVVELPVGAFDAVRLRVLLVVLRFVLVLLCVVLLLVVLWRHLLLRLRDRDDWRGSREADERGRGECGTAKEAAAIDTRFELLQNRFVHRTPY